jgi:hypothetical protein
VLGRCGVPMEQAREPLAAVVPRQTA